jgi:hypothetical protein
MGNTSLFGLTINFKYYFEQKITIAIDGFSSTGKVP